MDILATGKMTGISGNLENCLGGAKYPINDSVDIDDLYKVSKAENKSKDEDTKIRVHLKRMFNSNVKRRGKTTAPSDNLRKSATVQCKLCIGVKNKFPADKKDIDRYELKLYDNEKLDGNMAEMNAKSLFFLHDFKVHVKLHKQSNGVLWDAETYTNTFGFHSDIKHAAFHKCHLCEKTILFTDDKIRNHLNKHKGIIEKTDYFRIHLYPFKHNKEKALAEKRKTTCFQCSEYKRINNIFV